MDNTSWKWIIEEYIKYRLELNVSHTDISSVTDMPRSTIDRIEKLIQCPSLATMQRLLNSLGYTLSITKIDDVKDEMKRQQLLDCYTTSSNILVERWKAKRSKADDIRELRLMSQLSNLTHDE